MEPDKWLDLHATDLEHLADAYGAELEFVQVLAVMVVGGLDDGEIYDQLQTLPNPDGQRNPYAAVPDLLSELRRVATDA